MWGWMSDSMHLLKFIDFYITMDFNVWKLISKCFIYNDSQCYHFQGKKGQISEGENKNEPYITRLQLEISVEYWACFIYIDSPSDVW